MPVSAVDAEASKGDRRRQLGEAIKRRRLELGLTQEALAQRLGVHKMTVSKYESGALELTSSRLQDIAAAMETTVAEFYGLRGSMLEEAIYQELLQRGFTVEREPVIQAPEGGPRFMPDFLITDPATGRRWYVEAKSGAGPHVEHARNMLAMIEGMTGIPGVILTEPVIPDELPESPSRLGPGPKRSVAIPPRDLRVMTLRFEAEALELGADDSDMDHIREVLRSAAESTMGARGHQELNPADARSEMELHIAMLREWLLGRIERRKRMTPPRPRSTR